VAQAEKLLQRYRLEKQRGNKLAINYLQEAASIAPTYSFVVELQGDELMESGKRKEAIEAYKRAMTLSPASASAEKKHANLVFMTHAAGVTMMASAEEAVTWSRTASLFNVFLPGLGQLVTRQTTKGVCIMVAWVLLLVWLVSVPNGLSKLPEIVRGGSSEFNGLVFVPLAGVALLWFGALMDMQMASKVMEVHRNREKVAPPKPPVDLPY
jgi:tetratricopeptide (TPR) repeat protein